MLITDKNILKNYVACKNLWLGIPSIEVTKGGRTFLTFYSGGTREEIGNYVLLIMSDDGKNFTEPIAVCFEENHRCYDPCLWIDPLGRLWFTWSRCPDDGLFGAICENPDDDEIIFGKEFFIGNNIMMNKPVVLSTGEWLFPVAVWNHGVRALPAYESDITPKGSFAYATYDNGNSFKKLGYADVSNRSFDEHIFLEMSDGKIRCFVRTIYGIGAADSYDGGQHWSKDFDTGYGGPCSRFHIKRLKSGRILLINHYNCSGRNNLTAMLSDDEGITFPYRLLLDERQSVSYPDATVDSEGMINITYDRERGCNCTCLTDVFTNAREILTARICEDDIINGHLVNEKSYLKNIAYKLTDYDGEIKNPYFEEKLYSPSEYAKYLDDTITDVDTIIEEVFNVYGINCSNIHNVEATKLDILIKEYKTNRNINTLNEIIVLVRNAESKISYDEENIVGNICNYILKNEENNISVEDIANEFHFSTNYIRHIFKKRTGLSITGFKRAQQIKKAKLLLKTTNDKIVDISSACRFENPSYFSEVFSKEVGMSPKKYRLKFND